MDARKDFDPSDAGRIELGRSSAARHRAICERHRVRPGEVRTTAKPLIDVAAVVPELAAHAATTIRLHPRFGDEPAADASKLGGIFLWPRDEPWPICQEHRIPYVTVLQIRAEEFPEVAFRPGTDLMQLLWCPRDHDEWVLPALFWRERSEVAHPRGAMPVSDRAFLEYVPLPCRIMPERVVEFPSLTKFYDLGIHDDPADTPAGMALAEWGRRTGQDEDMCEFYDVELSECRGTKIGGYPPMIWRADLPVCRCGLTMDFLSKIGSTEWGGRVTRWCPVEDRKHAESNDWEKFEAAREALGIRWGDLGSMLIFLCRQCPDWPIRLITKV